MVNETVMVPAPSGGRRFGISDGMILMVGLAIAMSAAMHLLVLMAEMLGRLCREVSAHSGDLPALPQTFWEAVRDPLRNTFWYGWQAASMALGGLTLAWVVVRLRRPRESWRGLLRQPGTVAVLAMFFGLFWGTGALITLFPGRFDGWNAAPSAIGGTVALAWLVLALSRRWRAEPGWIDGLGRGLGCLAIGLAVALPLILRI